MKRFSIALLCFCFFSFFGDVWAKDCFGTDYGYDPHSTSRRFAVVSSTDGYTNLRAKGSKNSSVIKKLPNGTLLNIWNPDENKRTWCFDDKLNGYIHVSQLKDIEEFKSIPVFRQEKFLRELKNSDISIVVKSKPFDRKKHSFTQNKNGDKYKIDGITTGFYSPSHLPSYEYDYVKIQFKNKSAFFLPKEALTGLFELSSDSPKIDAYYDKNNDMLFIHGYISDASVVADFLWVVKNKQYMKRSIYTD